jgi:hypothetical protein
MLGNLIFRLMSVGVEHKAGSGAFGCTNFHESGLWPCTLAEMLLNPLIGMLLVNAVSFGLFFIATAGVIAVTLLAWWTWRRRNSDGVKRDSKER